MIQMIFNFSSHLLFIFFAYYLLLNLVQWEKFLKVSTENAVKIRFLILMLSIGIGYLASSFFISVYEMSRQILLANSSHILSKIWYDRRRDFKKLENNPVWKK